MVQIGQELAKIFPLGIFYNGCIVHIYQRTERVANRSRIGRDTFFVYSPKMRHVEFPKSDILDLR